jgi:hypothetical protein
MESTPLFKSVLRKAVVKVGGGTKEEKIPLILVNDFLSKLKELEIVSKPIDH